MMLNEFITKALRTESTHNPLVKRVKDLGLSDRTYHAILGITTEIGELELAINKIDIPNIMEELGDIMWYLAVFIDDNKLDTNELNEVIEEVCKNNATLFKFEPMKIMINDALDLSKKTMFYNKEFNLNHYEFARKIILGVGTIIQKSEKFTFNNTLEAVIKKLEARYPEKFTDHNANHRDLKTERRVLEESVGQ